MKPQTKTIRERLMEYSASGNHIFYLGEGKGVRAAANGLSGMQEGHDPDLYGPQGERVMFLQYVPFDSEDKAAAEARQQAEDSMAEWSPENLEAILKEHPPVFSMEHYRANLERAFTAGYETLEQCRQNLLQKGIAQSREQLYSGLFIEDTTPFGNFFKTEDPLYPHNVLMLPRCDFFLNLLEKSPELDFVLYGTHVMGRTCFWMVRPQDVAEYRKQQLSTRYMKLINGGALH